MKDVIISVRNLTKHFSYSLNKKGFWRNLISPEKKNITAVDNIHFEVKRGERVAFIGPNGAGKSTSIKMMTGILHPTSGVISVAGLDPAKNRKELAYKIGTVFGQRSQLMFNLPVRDSFELFGRIYELSSSEIKSKQEKLFKLFGLEDIKDQPVRKLSLGERMRAEVALSLIHNPEIIFLDEPTIGLDIVAKRNLRKILKDLNEKEGVTIFLTSHDVGDIEALCERTILINHGKILVDEKTEDLAKEYLNEKRIKIIFKGSAPYEFIPEGEIVSREDSLLEIRVNTALYPLGEVMKKIVAQYEFIDITIENPPLEEVIRHMYEKQRA